MDHSQLEQEARRLEAEWRRVDPDRKPLTNDEYGMMMRWEENDFPDEQLKLTSRQTRDLLSGWFKREKART